MEKKIFKSEKLTGSEKEVTMEINLRGHESNYLQRVIFLLNLINRLKAVPFFSVRVLHSFFLGQMERCQRRSEGRPGLKDHHLKNGSHEISLGFETIDLHTRRENPACTHNRL